MMKSNNKLKLPFKMLRMNSGNKQNSNSKSMNKYKSKQKKNMMKKRKIKPLISQSILWKEK